MIVLEARKLGRTFDIEGQQVHALRPVSVKVGKGEFIAVIGPSGSGKSTLLNLLSGLDIPTQGEVLFRGKRLDAFDERALSRLRNEQFGFIFQIPYILPYKTVAENVALPFQYSGRGSERNTMWETVTRLLDHVGLTRLAMRYPSTLSGGELQRLVFARALVKNPDVVFADEPTGSLDAENSRRILELLRDQARRGITVVMATHDRGAIEYSTRRIDLDKFSYGSSR